jgi:hypothetical protein
MNGYGFVKGLGRLSCVFLFALLGVFFAAHSIYSEIATEVAFRRRYGVSWLDEFQKVHGAVSTARFRSAVCLVGIGVICGLLVWLNRAMQPAQPERYSWSDSRKRRRRQQGSIRERSAVLRRNAVLGIYFGVAAIAAGGFLVMVRTGFFVDHADQMVLGVIVFFAGYAGVIAGCANWLKAKEWDQTVVLIGLAPLGVVFIPFVRLVILAAPLLLLCAMVMMPLILIVVTFVLPDKSGRARRRGWGNRWRSGWQSLQTKQGETDAPSPSPANATAPGQEGGGGNGQRGQP